MEVGCPTRASRRFRVHRFHSSRAVDRRTAGQPDGAQRRTLAQAVVHSRAASQRPVGVRLALAKNVGTTYSDLYISKTSPMGGCLFIWKASLQRIAVLSMLTVVSEYRTSKGD